MRPKIILLDWDGTLADVVPISIAALNATRVHRGDAPLPEEEARCETAKALSSIFPAAEDRAYFIETHARMSAENPPPALPGANAFIRYVNRLRAQGVYVGVISNKPCANIEREIHAYGWNGMFDVIVGSDDVGKAKPDPAPMAKALERYPTPQKLRPRDILYIGDSNTDAQFARNCGTRFLGVGHGFTLPLKPSERCEDMHAVLRRIRMLGPERGGERLP